MYSQAAPVELRIKQKSVCVACQGKPCYNGSAQGHGCPWDVYPGGLTKNTYCGLCLECIRTCPHDNIAVNLRPLAADLERPATRLDEAFKSFVMLGSAMTYAAVLLGPWGASKRPPFGSVHRPGSSTRSSFWFSSASFCRGCLPCVLPREAIHACSGSVSRECQLHSSLLD